jgi:hypothetical protein
VVVVVVVVVLVVLVDVGVEVVVPVVVPLLAPTTLVAADVATVDPFLFVAVTLTRMVYPIVSEGRA